MNFFQKICLVLISINLLGSKYPEIQSNTCNCQPEKVKIDFNNCSLSEFDIIREAGAGGGGSASIINSGFSGCGVSVTRPVILISKNANFSFGTYTIKARAVTRIANQYLTIFGNVDLSAALAVGVQPKNTDDEGWDVYVNGKQLGGGRRPVPVVFPNWYEIKVRVTPDSISFWLDNNLMFETGNNRVNKFPKCGKIILPAFSTSEYDELTYEPFYDTAMFKITEISQTICQNSTFEGYSNSGIYTDFFSSDSICDSIRILNLTVGNEYINNLQYSICQGESFLGYNQSGIFTDTFQTAQGCDSIRVLNLTVNPTFQNNLNQNICQGESFLGYNQSGIFRDTFQTLQGCDSIRILVLKVDSNQIKPNFLGEDLTICDRDDYVLTSPVDGTIWSNGIISKSIRLRNDALVVAKIIDANGCEISDSIQIKFAKKFYLPNSFSPNGDGINDCYFPVLGDQFQPSDFEIKIYDRWGSIVFFSKDFKNCWDGKIKGENSNSGTFLSEIKYLDENCGQVNVVQNLFLVR
jgi:gliding motility-associated-like protein